MDGMFASRGQDRMQYDIVYCSDSFIEALGDAELGDIHQTFLDGFAREQGWSIEGIRETLIDSNFSFLIYDKQGVNLGYALYEIPEETFNDKSLLWENAICFRKELQGQGLSKAIFEKIMQMEHDSPIGYFGGRTQNPIVMHRYNSLGSVYPFDRSYLSEEGQELLAFLRRNINEVGVIKEFEEETGIGRKVYYRGRLGDYEVIEGTPHEVYLEGAKFNRDNGDTLVIISEIDEQFLL